MATSSRSLDRSPRSNWVEETSKAGGKGLPPYVREIARSIERKQGVPLSRAISLAIGSIKRWSRGGDNVNPDTRAKAAKALAQWEALKGRNKARQVKTSNHHLSSADTVDLASDGSVLTSHATGDGLVVLSHVDDGGRIVELARYVRTAAGAARYKRPIGSLIEPGYGSGRSGSSGGGRASGGSAPSGGGGRARSSSGSTSGSSGARASSGSKAAAAKPKRMSREERRLEAGRKLNRWADQGRAQALKREQRKIERWQGQRDGQLRARQKDVARKWLSNQQAGIPATDKRQRDLRAEQNAINTELKRRSQASYEGRTQGAGASATSADRLARMKGTEQSAALRNATDDELKTAASELRGRTAGGKPSPTLDAIRAEQQRRSAKTSAKPSGSSSSDAPTPKADKPAPKADTPAEKPKPTTPDKPAAKAKADAPAERPLSERLRNLTDGQLEGMDEALDKKGGDPSERHKAIKAERARRRGDSTPAAKPAPAEQPTPAPAPAAEQPAERSGLDALVSASPEQREQILRGLPDQDLDAAVEAMNASIADAAKVQNVDVDAVRQILIGRRGEVEREQMRRRVAQTGGKRAETGGRAERADAAQAARGQGSGPTAEQVEDMDFDDLEEALPGWDDATVDRLNAELRRREQASGDDSQHRRLVGAEQGRRALARQKRPTGPVEPSRGGAPAGPAPSGAAGPDPEPLKAMTDEQRQTALRGMSDRDLADLVTQSDVGSTRITGPVANAVRAEQRRRAGSGSTTPQPAAAAPAATLAPGERVNPAVVGTRRGNAQPAGRPMETGSRFTPAPGDDGRPRPQGEAPARPQGVTRDVTAIPTMSEQQLTAERADAVAVLRWHRQNNTPRTDTSYADARSRQRALENEATRREQAHQAAGSPEQTRQQIAAETNTAPPPAPWGDGPAMTSADPEFQATYRAATPQARAAHEDLAYRQERIHNESFTPGTRLVVEGHMQPARIVEVVDTRDRTSRTGPMIAVRPPGGGEETAVHRDLIRARAVESETAIDTVERLRQERMAVLRGGPSAGNELAQRRQQRDRATRQAAAAPPRGSSPTGAETPAERNQRLLQAERAQQTGRDAEYQADPATLSPEARTRVAQRMRTEAAAAATPAQESEMRRRADEIDAMNTGTVSPIGSRRSPAADDDDVAERAEARAAIDQDRPAPATGTKAARQKTARDRLKALEGTAAISLRNARLKSVDDDGLRDMLDVMNTRKGTQRLRGDVVTEMQRRGLPLFGPAPEGKPDAPASRSSSTPTSGTPSTPAGGSRPSGGPPDDGLGDNPMAARERQRAAAGKRTGQSPVRDALNTPDADERAEKLRRLSQSSRTKARRAMTPEQIDGTIEALRRMQREDRDPNARRIRSNAGKFVQELQDELRGRNDYDRDTGLSKSWTGSRDGSGLQQPTAAPARARTERDTPGTAANVQARQDAQGAANRRAERGLFPEQRDVPRTAGSLFEGPGDDRLTSAQIAELQAELIRETDPDRKAALRRRIARGRAGGTTQTANTSTRGVIDMAGSGFGGKKAPPFGKRKQAGDAGDGKPGTAHADLTDEQLTAAIAKAKANAKRASGKAAQTAAQTLVKLKAEQRNRGKTGKGGDGKKSLPPWLKTSNTGGAALDLANSPPRDVPDGRAGKAAAALARMGL